MFARTVGARCRLGERVDLAGFFINYRLGVFFFDVGDDRLDVVCVQHDFVSAESGAVFGGDPAVAPEFGWLHPESWGYILWGPEVGE